MKLISLEDFLREVDKVDNVKDTYNDKGEPVFEFDISIDDGTFIYPMEIHKTNFFSDICDISNTTSESGIMETLGVDFADETDIQFYEMAADEIHAVINNLTLELKEVIDLEKPEDIITVLKDGKYTDENGDIQKADTILEKVPYYVLREAFEKHEQDSLSDKLGKAMKEIYGKEPVKNVQEKNFDER